MKNSVLIGLGGAIITGIIIGVQASISNRGGNLIGPIKTGVLTNLGSGMFALLFIIVTVIWRLQEWRNIPTPTIGMLIFSGGLGLLVVIGVSFSLRYTGATAGIAALILGQLLISMIVDAMGWNGQAAIPITWQRIAGIVVMAIGVYLLVQRND